MTPPPVPPIPTPQPAAATRLVPRCGSCAGSSSSGASPTSSSAATRASPPTTWTPSSRPDGWGPGSSLAWRGGGRSATLAGQRGGVQAAGRLGGPERVAAAVRRVGRRVGRRVVGGLVVGAPAEPGDLAGGREPPAAAHPPLPRRPAARRDLGAGGAAVAERTGAQGQPQPDDGLPVDPEPHPGGGRRRAADPDQPGAQGPRTQAPGRSRGRVRPGAAPRLHPEEFGRFLAGCPAFYRGHFIVQVGTGLRSGELLGLRARRVDQAARRIEVVEVRYDAGRFGSGYKDRPKSDASIRRLAPQVHCRPWTIRVERRASGEASSVWQECNGEKGTELERARACPRACGPGFQFGASDGSGLGPAVSCHGGALGGGPVRCAAICRTGQVPRCAPRSPTKPRATEKSVRKSRPGGVPPAGRQRCNRYPAPPRREREAVPAPGGGWGPGGRRPTSAPPIDLLLPDSLGRRGAPSPGSARRVSWGRTG